MLGAAILPLLPSTDTSAGGDLTLLVVTLGIVVVVVSLVLRWARRSSASLLPVEPQVEQPHDRAA